MAKVLEFRQKKPKGDGSAKTDRTSRPARRRIALAVPLEVVTSVLKSGERLPVLVDSATWIPRSMAMRWVLYDRRYTCAESTLQRDVSALRFVYAWGEGRFPEGLEARLAARPLDHEDLVALKAFLIDPEVPGDAQGPAARTTGAAGGRALAAKLFLTWALNPASRNERGAAPADADAHARQIEGVLQPLAKHAGEGRLRIVPADAIVDAAEEVIRPRLDANGLFVQPLEWHPKNPFRLDTRVRNWLMWTMARDSGLRLGEILSLPTKATMRTPDGTYVMVRTDADRADDPRAHSPQAKTLSRAVPLSPHAQFALRAYMTMRGPGARVMGSAYLISARTKRPLSKNPANRIMREISEATGTHLRWHDLRHVWATEFARSVYRAARDGEYPVDAEATAMMALLTEKLRVLGGWSPTSHEPARYARAAIKEQADHLARGIQNARAERIAAHRRAAPPDWLQEPEEDLPW